MKRYICTSLFLLSCGLHAAESTLQLRNNEGRGVGYNKGYSTVDYLLTQNWEKGEFLFNFRGHAFNDGTLASNAGMGYRYALGEKSLLGGNLFYDFRETHHLFAQQMGAGLEFLSKWLDVRTNGYLPISKTSDFESKQFSAFSGNSILVRQKVHAALPLAEVEFGSQVARSFYLALSPYYLFNKNVHGIETGNAWGGRFRFAWEWGKYISVGAQVTYDRIFHTRAQGTLSLHIPLGKQEKTAHNKRNLRAIPIYRNEIIPTQKKIEQVPLSSDPTGESAITVVFVNNTFEGEELGTFEAPFSSLKEAEAHSHEGDVIYVYPGDGTPYKMDEGIVLKEDQQLVSSAFPIEIEGVEIPAATPGHLPVITNINQTEPLKSDTPPNPEHIVVISGAKGPPPKGFEILDPWKYVFGKWGNRAQKQHAFDSGSHGGHAPNLSWDIAHPALPQGEPHRGEPLAPVENEGIVQAPEVPAIDRVESPAPGALSEPHSPGVEHDYVVVPEPDHDFEVVSNPGDLNPGSPAADDFQMVEHADVK